MRRRKTGKEQIPGTGEGRFCTRGRPPLRLRHRGCVSLKTQKATFTTVFMLLLLLTENAFIFLIFYFFLLISQQRLDGAMQGTRTTVGGGARPPPAARAPTAEAAAGSASAPARPPAARVEGRPAHGPSPVSLEPQALRDAPGHPSSPGGPEATCMNAGRPTGSRRPQVLPAPRRRVTSQ